MRLRILGIGMGPQHVTGEVSQALRGCDVVVALDKHGTHGAHAGTARDEQLALREQVARDHGVPVLVVADPPRDRTPEDYATAVADWHRARVARLADALRTQRPDATVAMLVWGDPSLYDSVIRLAGQLEEALRDVGGLEWDVLPGISAPQLLAARHRMVLHPVGHPVHITTARRLREAISAGQRNVVVMLGSRDALACLADLPDWHIWWAANLGAAGETVASGRVGDVLPTLLTLRDDALAEAGWAMDLYLLRAPELEGPTA